MTMPSYGLGMSGQGGMSVTDVGTLKRHAVLLPWYPGEVFGVAVCHVRVRLVWSCGMALDYSLKDGELCQKCKEIVWVTGNRP